MQERVLSQGDRSPASVRPVTFLHWYLPLVRETLDRLPLTFWMAAACLELFLYYKVARCALRRRRGNRRSNV